MSRRRGFVPGASGNRRGSLRTERQWRCPPTRVRCVVCSSRARDTRVIPKRARFRVLGLESDRICFGPEHPGQSSTVAGLSPLGRCHPALGFENVRRKLPPVSLVPKCDASRRPSSLAPTAAAEVSFTWHIALDTTYALTFRPCHTPPITTSIHYRNQLFYLTVIRTAPS